MALILPYPKIRLKYLRICMQSKHFRRIRIKDIEHLLDLCGYMLMYFYIGKDGIYYPPIETAKNLFICRCMKKSKDPIQNSYYKFMFAKAQMEGKEIPFFQEYKDISVVFIEEFEIYKIDYGNPGCSDEELLKTFKFYMFNRYKKWNYEADYNAYHAERERIRQLYIELSKQPYVYRKKIKKGRPRGVHITDKNGRKVVGFFVPASKALLPPDHIPKPQKNKYIRPSKKRDAEKAKLESMQDSKNLIETTKPKITSTKKKTTTKRSSKTTTKRSSKTTKKQTSSAK